MPRASTQMTVNCAHCATLVTRPKCFIEGRKDICCSRECTLALQRSGRKQADLPAGSFMLREDAAAVTAKVRELIDAGHNGPQIMQLANITRGEMQGILKRNAWKIAKNVVRKFGEDSAKWVALVKFNCAFCGKENARKPYDVKGKDNLYCDQKCQHGGLSKLKGHLSPKYIAPQVLECNWCKKSYNEPKDVKPGRDSKFCGRDCWSQWAKSLVGPKHPRFVGLGKYRGESWASQRTAAARRDRGVCQMCDLDVGEQTIAVHHIRPFRLFGDDHVSANALTNLVSLCSGCHAEVEGRTDDGDITNWREHYEANKGFPRRMSGQKVRELKAAVKKDFADGMAKSAIARKYKVGRLIVYACLDMPRKRRLKI